ncbi:MAG TPA: LytTR family DNA-binding domain-containing protein [Tenuifilaceae bacterium]|nr:LytTR family DNA-binding domain-containing protein [Tenuifilaceae bacterium]
MKYIITEDEKPTAERLKRMISNVSPDLEHLVTFDSVSSAVKWLNASEHPDLAFFDIQLADGLSFEIFEQVQVEFPVIFTTAFNEYAIKAFKVNSIDYLLKPIDETELKNAIEKFQKGFSKKTKSFDSDAIERALAMLTNTYKTRFVVKVGEHIRMIPVEEIALIYSSEKSSFIRVKTGRDYGIDNSLDTILAMLNPTDFFRVSRKHIVSLSSISDIISYSGSRLKLKLNVQTEEDIIVSREKVAEFKEWLDR